MVLWSELVADATEVLRQSEVPDPQISARRIGQRATGTEGATWLDALNTDATQRHVAHFDAMVERRRSGEPLQYVIGQWGFRHLDLFVDNRVLIPRPETEVVAGLALDELKRLAGSDENAEAGATTQPESQPLTVVDIGTGSGAIGLSVAHEHPSALVWLTDISADALAVARANLAGLGRSGSRVRIVEGSLFESLPSDLAGSVAVVVSNPPYVERTDAVDPEVAWEPDVALFASPGTVLVEALIQQAPAWLIDDGALAIEMAPHQVEEMAVLARHYFAEVETRSDMAGRLRAIVARSPLRPLP